jgi:hypothetical protein
MREPRRGCRGSFVFRSALTRHTELMAVSDSEIESLLARLARDTDWTIPWRKRRDVQDSVSDVRAAHGWRFDDGEGIEAFTEMYVEDIQQWLMDTFVDTSWPTCPRHGRHPLWFHDGAWHCDLDRVALAQLGELASVLPALPPEEPVAPGAFVRRPKSR